MQTETVLYIILSGIIALLLALFQYLKKEKSLSKKQILFSFLRFVSYFGTLLLIINPKFKSQYVFTEKPNLVIAVDNTSSVKHLKQDQKALELVTHLKTNKKLQEKFNLAVYTFDNDLKSSDSINFKGTQTHITNAFKNLNQIYKHSVSPTILITDGNATYGIDYASKPIQYNQPVYPIILGDTISYTDLKIQQLNVNKYAYLKNKFPVEAILVYEGHASVSSKFQIIQKNQVIYSEVLHFTKLKNSHVLNFTLPTTNVGVTNLKAEIIPLENEKNKTNNLKNFAIEVIDQKSKIALVSDILHPDIGAFKKSIERNELRSVSILHPNETTFNYDDFQLIIIYQPNFKFNKIYQKLKATKRNVFIIIGAKTDLGFINKNTSNYQIEITNQFENYQAELNEINSLMILILNHIHPCILIMERLNFKYHFKQF
ncbi:hypothetical protein [Tamlana fucoidanivorans]|uniref:hypothetical protein n=1 Tax=Allotamlana fucoidanivorans TaxID=2583814 RepID=UPI003892BE2F